MLKKKIFCRILVKNPVNNAIHDPRFQGKIFVRHVFRLIEIKKNYYKNFYLSMHENKNEIY